MTERSQHNSQSGSCFALAVPGIDNNQSFFNLALSKALILNFFAPLHFSFVLRFTKALLGRFFI